jgi:molybdate transport system substrate-binding protein
MRTRPRLAALVAATGLLTAAPARADEVRVMTSGAFTAAYLELVKQFEARTGHTVVTAFGASMGGASDSIPSRLSRGEPVDAVIVISGGLDALVADGRILPESRVDLARSLIGIAVRSGTPRPDIRTVEALRQTLLRAGSIAYSASASGTYVSTELFPRLGIEDAVKGKSKRIESERVGAVVARGEAEIGFQQVSELLPIAGIDYIGPLPDEVQQVSIIAAGIATRAQRPGAARALIDFLASADAAPVIEKSGLEPIRHSARPRSMHAVPAQLLTRSQLTLVTVAR